MVSLPGQPVLTVIVPARNEAPNIAACLESLLAQDYPKLLHHRRSTIVPPTRLACLMDGLAHAAMRRVLK